MKTRNIILVMVTALLCFIIAVYVVLSQSTKAAEKLAHLVAAEFKGAFNTTPSITVNSRVVLSETHPIAELATASKMVAADTTYMSTWLHSTKYISLRGEFVAKAGFDLGQRFTIDIKTHPKSIVVTLPNPKILSLEMLSSEITDQQGGVVNWLSPQDHEDALKQLKEEARRQVLRASFMDAARAEMEKRVKAVAALRDIPVTIQYAPANQIGPLMPQTPAENKP